MTTEIFPGFPEDTRCRAAFWGRVSGVDVDCDRDEALKRLAKPHQQALRELGLGELPLVTAEQVHGNRVALVGEPSNNNAALPGEPHALVSGANALLHEPIAPLPGIDALITRTPGVCLGIYVADCCAVYAWDAEHAALGLAHSGKKGTELRIVPAMLRAMEAHFGTDPAKTVVALSPCIRPPFYEVDFAQEIVRQCQELGVRKIQDAGANTAADLEAYYSYRIEKGRTGRMLAVGVVLG